MFCINSKCNYSKVILSQNYLLKNNKIISELEEVNNNEKNDITNIENNTNYSDTSYDEDENPFADFSSSVENSDNELPF